MFFCTFANFAEAAPLKQTVLTYDVYAGGIHAMNAQLTLRRDKTSTYDVALTAETQGLLKQLANWSGKFTSKGVLKNGAVYPLTHQSASTWKNKTEAKTFRYDGKGHFISYNVTEAGVDKTPKDIDLTLAKDTTDTLSSTLRLMMSMPKSKVCDGKELIFDGDRNFRLTYTNTKAETLKKNDYNIYDGAAISCNVEVIPEKGKWRKKPRGWLSIQEQGRNKGALPTVWFGQVAGGNDTFVPVKIKVTTDYGVLFMHLTSAKVQ
jgi:hypothetical protein